MFSEWRCLFLNKFKYFSSSEAENCVRNSSLEWMKNRKKNNSAAQELMIIHYIFFNLL